uniref:Uncharacterized protein n=1 Tax=Molossus molossus TaxID=27622 RepID=A0A7J8JXK2_MOLMO|nr:hypothetical protein HJG59_007887 [Molossus molossus]
MAQASEINVHLDSNPAGMTEGDLEQENDMATLRVMSGPENTRVLIVILKVQKQKSQTKLGNTQVQRQPRPERRDRLRTGRFLNGGGMAVLRAGPQAASSERPLRSGDRDALTHVDGAKNPMSDAKC